MQNNNKMRIIKLLTHGWVSEGDDWFFLFGTRQKVDKIGGRSDCKGEEREFRFGGKKVVGCLAFSLSSQSYIN